MTDLLNIPKPNAYCAEVPAKNLGGVNIAPELRVMCISPDGLDLQFRTFRPLTGSGNGVKRNIVSGATLNIDECRQLMMTLHRHMGAESPLQILADELQAHLRVLEVAASVAGTNGLPNTEECLTVTVRSHRKALARVMG